MPEQTLASRTLERLGEGAAHGGAATLGVYGLYKLLEFITGLNSLASDRPRHITVTVPEKEEEKEASLKTAQEPPPPSTDSANFVNEALSGLGYGAGLGFGAYGAYQLLNHFLKVWHEMELRRQLKKVERLESPVEKEKAAEYVDGFLTKLAGEGLDALLQTFRDLYSGAQQAGSGYLELIKAIPVLTGLALPVGLLGGYHGLKYLAGPTEEEEALEAEEEALPPPIVHVKERKKKRG